MLLQEMLVQKSGRELHHLAKDATWLSFRDRQPDGELLSERQQAHSSLPNCFFF